MYRSESIRQSCTYNSNHTETRTRIIPTNQNIPSLDHEFTERVGNCIGDILCTNINANDPNANCKRTTRVISWTVIGAGVGSLGGPGGTVLGAIGGFGVGLCTIL